MSVLQKLNLDHRSFAMQQAIYAVFHPVCHPEGSLPHLYQQGEGRRGFALQHTLLGPPVACLLITCTTTWQHSRHVIYAVYQYIMSTLTMAVLVRLHYSYGYCKLQSGVCSPYMLPLNGLTPGLDLLLHAA